MRRRTTTKSCNIADKFLPGADAPSMENIGFARIIDAFVMGHTVVSKHETHAYYAGPEVTDSDTRNKRQEAAEIIIPIAPAEHKNAYGKLVGAGLKKVIGRKIKNTGMALQESLVIPLDANPDAFIRIMAAFAMQKTKMLYDSVDNITDDDQAMIAAYTASRQLSTLGLSKGAQDTLHRVAQDAVGLHARG